MSSPEEIPLEVFCFTTEKFKEELYSVSNQPNIDRELSQEKAASVLGSFIRYTIADQAYTRMTGIPVYAIPNFKKGFFGAVQLGVRLFENQVASLEASSDKESLDCAAIKKIKLSEEILNQAQQVLLQKTGPINSHYLKVLQDILEISIHRAYIQIAFENIGDVCETRKLLASIDQHVIEKNIHFTYITSELKENMWSKALVGERIKNMLNKGIYCLHQTAKSAANEIDEVKDLYIQEALASYLWSLESVALDFSSIEHRVFIDPSIASRMDSKPVSDIIKEAILEGYEIFKSGRSLKESVAFIYRSKSLEKALNRNLSPFHEQRGMERIRSLSQENIGMLKKMLAPLTQTEYAFIARLVGTQFYATHATNAVNEITNNPHKTLTLFSTKKLTEREIFFQDSSCFDTDKMGNSDFVFFSLEGPSQQGEKTSSRFGNTIFKIDFDLPVFKQVAWLSLMELFSSPFPVSMRSRLIRNLEGTLTVEARAELDKIDCSNLETNNLLKHLEWSKFDAVFFGSNMKEGLALSIVRYLRRLPNEADRNLFLNHQNINELVNGIFRPEIKVPKHFFAKHGTYSVRHSTDNFFRVIC